MSRFLFALLLLVATQQAFAQQANHSPGSDETMLVFEGVDRFYEVADTLSKGQEPTAIAWNALFGAPGYARYLADSEEDAAAFADLIRLVFDPANQTALADTLRAVEGDLDFDHLPFFAVLGAKQRRTAVEAFRRQLTGSEVAQEAADEAARLLPAGATAAPLPLVFNVYKLDGTGTPDRVIADLVFMEKVGVTGTRLFLAHEVHHAVRNRLSNLDLPARDEDPRYYLLIALNQLQAEGIADRIDKADFFSNRFRRRVGADTSAAGRWFGSFFLDYYARGYERAYEATPETVRRVDSLIAVAARADATDDHEALAEASEAVYRLLPINAHPNGYFLANTIAGVLGENALVEDVANPFAFARLYNRAAEQSDGGLPMFSAESMAYFDRLEAQYMNRKR